MRSPPRMPPKSPAKEQLRDENYSLRVQLEKLQIALRETKPGTFYERRRQETASARRDAANRYRSKYDDSSSRENSPLRGININDASLSGKAAAMSGKAAAMERELAMMRRRLDNSIYEKAELASRLAAAEDRIEDLRKTNENLRRQMEKYRRATLGSMSGPDYYPKAPSSDTDSDSTTDELARRINLSVTKKRSPGPKRGPLPRAEGYASGRSSPERERKLDTIASVIDLWSNAGEAGPARPRSAPARRGIEYMRTSPGVHLRRTPERKGADDLTAEQLEFIRDEIEGLQDKLVKAEAKLRQSAGAGMMERELEDMRASNSAMRRKFEAQQRELASLLKRVERDGQQKMNVRKISSMGLPYAPRGIRGARTPPRSARRVDTPPRAESPVLARPLSADSGKHRRGKQPRTGYWVPGHAGNSSSSHVTAGQSAISYPSPHAHEHVHGPGWDSTVTIGPGAGAGAKRKGSGRRVHCPQCDMLMSAGLSTAYCDHHGTKGC